MPLATTAMCRCHITHHEVKVRSSGKQWHEEESEDMGTVLSKDRFSIKCSFVSH